VTDVPAEPAYCSYGEFGRRFFAYAVTEKRILGAVGDLAGSAISFGPIGAGPARIAKVTAEGQIGAASVKRLDGLPDVGFELSVPVDLELRVDLGVDLQRFDAHADVRLRLTARAISTRRRPTMWRSSSGPPVGARHSSGTSPAWTPRSNSSSSGTSRARSTNHISAALDGSTSRLAWKPPGRPETVRAQVARCHP
jgi:hypothetical protein